MAIAEQQTVSLTIEAFKSQCSPLGKRVLDSSEYFAKRHEHNQVQIADVVHAMFWHTTTLAELQRVGINPQEALQSFVGIMKNGLKKTKPAGSIQDIFNVALEMSMHAESSRVRAGDILMAIYTSPTEAGEAFKEALQVNHKRRVRLPSALKGAIYRIENPHEA